MKIEFEADYQDFGEIIYLSWKQSSTSERLLPLFYFYSLYSVIPAIAVYVFSNGNLWGALATLSVILFVSLYFYPIPTLNTCLEACKKNLGANSFYPIEISITESGIRVSQLGNEYLYGWNNIVTFLDHPNRLCFFTIDKVGISIPKRAMPSLNEQARLIAFAQSRMNGDAVKT